jgi:hypothetical protein
MCVSVVVGSVADVQSVFFADRADPVRDVDRATGFVRHLMCRGARISWR